MARLAAGEEEAVAEGLETPSANAASSEHMDLLFHMSCAHIDEAGMDQVVYSLS